MRLYLLAALSFILLGCNSLKSNEADSSVQESKALQAFVLCEYDRDGRQVRFYPQFGQIFYHRADGTQIDDQEGITFHKRIQARSYGAPDEVIMTLKNEKDEKIGSWRYEEGKKSFHVKFEGALTIQKSFYDCRWSNGKSTGISSVEDVAK